MKNKCIAGKIRFIFSLLLLGLMLCTLSVCCAETRLPADVKKGDTVLFGVYEQDNSSSNGEEPIEWYVIKREGDRALLMSKYGLTCKKFHDVLSEGTSWGNCYLRGWLNSSFYDDAFSDSEKALIYQTEIDYYHHDSIVKHYVTDNVFLLSYDEYCELVMGNSMRAGKPTAYAQKRGMVAKTGFQVCWTRSVSEMSSSICYYLTDVYGESEPHTNEWLVRPSLWVNVEGESISTAEEGFLRVSDEKRLIGSRLTMGTYEQDNDLQNGQEPITWVVGDVTDNKALLISEYILDCKLFDTAVGTSWKDSTLRKWLNEDFYSAAFSETEKTSIVQSWVSPVLCSITESDGYYTNYSYDVVGQVKDNVFIRDDKYWNTEMDTAFCRATPYAVAQGVQNNKNGYAVWWTMNQDATEERVKIRCGDGRGWWPCYLATEEGIGVRPMMWVSLSKPSDFPVPCESEGDVLPSRENQYALPYDHVIGETMSQKQVEHSNHKLLGVEGSKLLLERSDDNLRLEQFAFFFPNRTDRSQAQDDFRIIEAYLAEKYAALEKQTGKTDYMFCFELVTALGKEMEEASYSHYYDSEYGIHIEHLLTSNANENWHQISYYVDDMEKFEVAITPSKTAETVTVSADKGSFRLRVDNVHQVDWGARPGTKMITVQCVLENVDYIDGEKGITNWDIADSFLYLEDDEGFLLEYYNISGGDDGLYDVGFGVGTAPGKKRRISIPFYAAENCGKVTVYIGDEWSDEFTVK